MASPSSHGLILGSVPHVNLMPRSEIERRGRKVLIHRWLGVMLAVLLLIGVVALGGFSLKIAADLRLASERNRTTALQNELAALADVSSMLRQEADLTSYREEAMSTDLGWSQLLTTIASALPAGSTITNFTAEAGDGRLTAEPQGVPGPRVSLTVTTVNPIDMVGVIRALRGVPGLHDADGMEQRNDTTAAVDPEAPRVYSYVLTVVASDEMYTGRFAPEEPAAAEED